MLFRADMIEKKNAEDLRNHLKAAAFTAFLQGASNGKNWIDYQVAIGLRDKVAPMSKEAKKKIVDKSHKIAERIMRMDRKRPKKK